MYMYYTCDYILPGHMLQNNVHHAYCIPGEYVRNRTSGFSAAITPISALRAALVVLYIVKLGKNTLASREVILTTYLSPVVNLERKREVRMLIEVKFSAS